MDGPLTPVMQEWVAGLGPVAECTACARLEETDIHLRPQLGWLADEALLGKELSRTLSSIYRNRPGAVGKQFYVGLPGAGNPAFEHEPAYPAIKLPDAVYQLLALYRFGNMIEYWFPYRDAIGENWDGVLARIDPGGAVDAVLRGVEPADAAAGYREVDARGRVRVARAGTPRGRHRGFGHRDSRG